MGTLSMKVLVVLVSVVACAAAQNVVCGKGSSTDKEVTVEDKKTYTFKTQKGKKYPGNTECTVKYKMGDSCAKMSFVRNKFNTNNKDKKKCTKGDKLTVTANGTPKAYCKTKKPQVSSTGDISVVFTSDKKKSGSGAICKVKCTEAVGSGTGVHPQPHLTGEALCEGSKMTKARCVALSCCEWDGGRCWWGGGECPATATTAKPTGKPATTAATANTSSSSGSCSAKVSWTKKSVLSGFDKYEVFGIPAFCETGGNQTKCQHMLSVLAAYIDNNNDGCPDNPPDFLKNILKSTIPAEEPGVGAVILTKKQSFQMPSGFQAYYGLTMWEDETRPECSGTQATDNCRDASPEPWTWPGTLHQVLLYCSLSMEPGTIPLVPGGNTLTLPVSTTGARLQSITGTPQHPTWACMPA